MDDNNIKDEIENSFKHKNGNGKIYAVMLFDTGLTLGISQQPNKWINFGNVYFEDGGRALAYYANTPCPASQLIDATDTHDLEIKMNDMINNYKDDNWLQENLYPYL